MVDVLNCVSSVVVIVGFGGLAACACISAYGEWVAAKKNKALARLFKLRADALENEKHD